MKNLKKKIILEKMQNFRNIRNLVRKETVYDNVDPMLLIIYKSLKILN